MAEIKITKCKSCGAPITWIKTKNGRVMPCDVPAVDYQENYKGTDTVVTDDGARIARNGIQNPVAVGLATYNRRQRLYIAFRDLPVCKQVSEARQ